MNPAANAGSSALPMPDFSDTFPGPFPVSPHAGRTEQHLLQWLHQFPFLPPSATLRSLCNITGQGIARTLPTAGPDDLTLCAALFLWLTAFDDTHGESAAARDLTLLVDHIAELTLVLADSPTVPSASADPFAAALQDLLARFRTRATPAQYLRLTGHLRDNLTGLVWEAHQLAVQKRVSVPTYCEMRPCTVFVRTIVAATEIALKYELSDEQRSSQPVRDLDQATANLAGWINDLASYTRESAHTKPLSLPTLLMAEHGYSTQEAFHRISSLCEQQAEIARSRITLLSASETGPLRAHAEAVGHIAHSFMWHVDHSRYWA